MLQVKGWYASSTEDGLPKIKNVANVNIKDYTALTSPVSSDQILAYDASVSALRSLTLGTLFTTGIPTLTDGRVVIVGTGGVLTDDAGLTYDAGTNIITAGGFSGPLNGTVGATTPAAGTFTTLTVNTNANPDANDGAGLGTGALGWSDLFLASGGVINWNNGNYTATHSAGLLTLSGSLAVGGTTITTSSGTPLTIDDNAAIGVGLVVTGGGSGGPLATFTRDIGSTGTVTINSSGGDPQIVFTTTNTFAIGADGTSFKISDNSALGTNDRLTIDSTGNVLIGGTLGVTGAITGSLTGNASTATTLQTARTIGGVSFNGSANIVPQTIQVVDSTDATSFVAMFDSATGDLQPKTDSGVQYDSSTGQFKLPTVGSGAGLLIGGDAQIYRSAADVLRTPDSFTIDATLTAATVNISGTVTLTGTAANIATGSNFISNGGTDAGLSFDSSNNATLSADLAVNGGDLTTSATTFNLLNATATTVNFAGGASTALNIGHASGVITLGGSGGITKDGSGLVGVNRAAPAARLHVEESGSRTTLYSINTAANQICSLSSGDNDAYASTVNFLATYATAGTGFNFWACQSDSNGTPDTEAYMRGDGQGFQDGGTAWSTPADYAEFMESLDGKEIPVGKSVVLESGKVRHAKETDNPDDVIGVIRPRSGSGSIVANAGDLRWQGKYLKDEDGDYLLEDYRVFDWDETLEDGSVVHHNKADYKMPKGVTPPPDAKVTVCKKRKLNPAFDPAQKFKPRRERPEWNLVGMVGQVPIEKGQPVNPRWRKMFDLSTTKEQWFIR